MFKSYHWKSKSYDFTKTFNNEKIWFMRYILFDLGGQYRFI